MRKRSLRRRINPDSRFKKNNPMKQTVTEFQFVEAFRHAGRETQFSVPARRALFDYLESFEHDSGTELELDPIGICCEFAEYPCALEAAKVYGLELRGGDEESRALDWLREKTQVVEFEGGIVIQQF